MPFPKIAIFLCCISFFFSCQPQKEKTNYETIELIATEAILEEAAYPELVLGGCNYVNDNFKMMISGLTLGVRTPGSAERKGAATKKGAYLHIVLNDSLHMICHHRNTPTKIPDGNYSISAFVARDFHESVKHTHASMCRDITLKNGKMQRSIKSSEARLVYGAPWGIFKNEETKQILLDFYLMNTSISPKGNKVRLIIDQQKEFLISDWKSYYIKGLGAGLHQLTLELINSKGEVIYGPIKQQISCLVEEGER